MRHLKWISLLALLLATSKSHATNFYSDEAEEILTKGKVVSEYWFQEYATPKLESRIIYKGRYYACKSHMRKTSIELFCQDLVND